jgi:hypothetical protein
MPLDIIENLNLEKPSFGPSKWPRKLKPAKNSKLPKWPENCFEPFGKGGWTPISTWIMMALVLSQYIGMGSSYSTCISVKVCFIQRTCVQHVAAPIYSALAVDRDTDDCFLLSHDTKHSPK